MLARRLRIWPNIKSACGTVSTSCLLRICRSKNNHSHTTSSLHHKHDKHSDVNNITCACMQCTSAAHAHQCNTGTSKQTQDNQMAVCIVYAFVLFCYETDNRLFTLTLLWATIVAQNKPSTACCGRQNNFFFHFFLIFLFTFFL